MRFKISGVDSTGRDRTIILTAASEKDALAKAKINGIFPDIVTVSGDNEKDPPPKPIEPQPQDHPKELTKGTREFRGRYIYKMVQIPPTISVKEGAEASQLAAYYLQDVVNQYAIEGWDFYRVDEIGIYVEPGCLASLFASGPSRQSYYVVTFRKPAK